MYQIFFKKIFKYILKESYPIKWKQKSSLNRPYRTQVRLRVHMVKCLDKDSILVYSDDLSFWTMLHNSCSIQSNKFRRICSPDCFFFCIFYLPSQTQIYIKETDLYNQYETGWSKINIIASLK